MDVLDAIVEAFAVADGQRRNAEQAEKSIPRPPVEVNIQPVSGKASNKK